MKNRPGSWTFVAYLLSRGCAKDPEANKSNNTKVTDQNTRLTIKIKSYNYKGLLYISTFPP